tara:strand:- start:1114 stop:1785 length:672 start_codon:yes stop_codon:yes gene_type:complete
MAYGIEIQRPSTGNYILNGGSSFTGTSMITTGTGSSVTINADDILMFKPTGMTSGTTKWITAIIERNGSEYTCDFKLCSETGSSVSTTTCDYIVLEAATNVTSLSGNYGLIQYGEDGTTKIFDSRIYKMTGEMDIDDVASAPEPNNQFLYGSSDFLDRYVCANVLYHDTMTNLVIRHGVRFSNAHSTHGTAAKIQTENYSPYGTTNPSSFGTYFSGVERTYGD